MLMFPFLATFPNFFLYEIKFNFKLCSTAAEVKSNNQMESENLNSFVALVLFFSQNSC